MSINNTTTPTTTSANKASSNNTMQNLPQLHKVREPSLGTIISITIQCHRQASIVFKIIFQIWCVYWRILITQIKNIDAF